MTSSVQRPKNPPAEAERFVDLFRHGHAGAVSVLAGGFLLAAITSYFTAALMPSIVAEIGGQELYAWPTTVYIIVSVIGAALVNQCLSRLGPSRSYLLAFGVYVAGAIVCTFAIDMTTLLVGRALVGLSGGLLSGLGYAVIRTVLPQQLWSRATALISATFGAGTLLGPILGGVFAQYDAWREALAVVAVFGIVLGALTPKLLPATARTGDVEQIPLGSILLLVAVVATMSVASIVPGSGRFGLLALALVVLAIFLAWDRRARSGVFPKSAYQSGSPMRWILLTNALLTIAVVSEAFAPLFGQSMAGLAPVVAGLFGGAISFGWSFFGLLGARASEPRSRSRLAVLGPALLAFGLAAMALTQSIGASAGVALGWFVLMVVAGAGIGLGFPAISYAVMSNVRDGSEAAKAGAAIPLVGLIAQSFGSALGGLLVNIGLPSMSQGATNLFAGLAVLAAFGVLSAVMAVRRGAFAP